MTDVDEVSDLPLDAVPLRDRHGDVIAYVSGSEAPLSRHAGGVKRGDKITR